MKKQHLLLFLGFLFSLPSLSEVYKVDIESREDVLEGKSFGAYGAYELIKGKVYFRFDPENQANRAITDLELAIRNAQGMIEAWTDLVVLQPKDPGLRRKLALVEVSNRGGKFSPRYFNRAESGNLNISTPGDFGDGLLMEQGLTVIWIGWQFDVPPNPGLLRLNVPIAKQRNGQPISGLVRSEWTIDETVYALGLGHRQQLAYPVADPNHPATQLTVREGRDDIRKLVPRERWRFARIDASKKVIEDATDIYMEAGFEAGKIYELVYRAQDPPVVGLGLGAIRDIISYAKYDPNCEFGVEQGIAVGVSQTGRLLRHLLYQGFNRDENDRTAYDGMMIITAGAGRGSFNHRFAQPSRDAHRYSAFFYPTDLFPFTSQNQFDPISFKSDGLLSKVEESYRPKIFYINTGYEYWGRAASLIHTSVDGTEDIAPLANERIYHLASGQHFVPAFPPKPEMEIDHGVYRGNPLDYSVNYRALLVSLVNWVDQSEAPPESRYPSIADGNLVAIDQTGFPQIPKVVEPEVIHTAYRANYGTRWDKGIMDIQPPELGPEFIPKVSKVDIFGNESAGIRNVELLVPLATYTPWSLRSDFKGGKNELVDFMGSFIPLPKTDNEKERKRDPRPSLKKLYKNKKIYLAEVQKAAEELKNQGFLLEQDQSYVIDRSGQYWDWIWDPTSGVK